MVSSDRLIEAQTYDAIKALAATDADLFWILPFCAVSFIGAYMQYFGAIRNGFKDKAHSIPLGCNLWFFAHDTTFLMLAPYWFNEVDHWLMTAFWGMLLVFAICESVVIYQVLRYSRNKLFPGLTLSQAVFAFVVCQSAAYIVFWWFHEIISDPLYLISFTTTVLLTPLLTIPMMLQRGTRQGYSPFMLTGYVLLAVGFYPWVYQVDAYFTQPVFVVFGIVNILISVVPLLLYYRLPAYQALEDETPASSGFT